MNSRMRFTGTVLAAVFLAFSSCSSAPSWQSDWGHSSSWSSPFGRKSKSSGLAVSSDGMPATDPVTSATQSVNKAFKAAGGKVASALDVKPKVIPAHDPSKLSSRPERLTPALYVQAAQLSENQGAMAQAKRQYEKALELDPRDVNTLVAMARFHDRQGQADEALQQYEQARELAPANTIVLNDLGLFHARHGNLDAALEALDQAVQLDSQNVRYRNNLAAAMIEAKLVAEAVDVLRGIHPEATALFNTACLLAMKDDTQSAVDLLERSLRIDPSHQAARQMLQELRSETLIARAKMPLPDQAAVSIATPLSVPLETASRRSSTVWESTSVEDHADRSFELHDLPRKLPAAD